MKPAVPERVQPGPASMAGTWVAVAALVLAGLLTYSNNYQGEFIFDDFPAIVDNPGIQSIFNVGELLRPAPNTPLSARPVAAISFALNYALGGLDVTGYHLINNLIHILAGLALFALVRTTLLLPRFTGVYGSKANGYGAAAALIWLVHPLNSETVNYLVSRTELLVGLLYLATMYCVASSFRAERSRNWQAAAVTCCALGMASKEVMVSAPLMVLLYDRLLVSESFSEALRKRSGMYAALAATWLVVGFYQLDSPRADSVLFDSAQVSVLDYFRTQLVVLLHYLKLSFWPSPLVLDSQDWPIVRSFSTALILPLLVLGSLATAAVVGIWRGAWWSLLGAWFFCILAPTSSVIPIVTEIVSERRMYLPLAAIVVGVVFAADFFWGRLHSNFLKGGKVLRQAPALACIVLVLLLASMTFSRNGDYRSAGTIWADTVRKRPENFRAQENLGKALLGEGRFQEAAQHLEKAIALFPEEKIDSDLFVNLARAYSESGQFREAAAAQREALKLQPKDALGQYNLGNALLRMNDREGAVRAFTTALEIDPALIPAHGNLGLLLMQQGDFAGAEAHFQALVRLAPQDVTALVFLGDLRAKQGRRDEAAGVYRQALRLAPGAPEISERLQQVTAPSVR